MPDWTDLISQALSALLGTVVGGAITVFVARWQTAKTINAQTQLAAEQHAASAQLARAERERENSAAAAKQLLERLADLYAWLPSLPDVALENPRLSEHARVRCADAMESVRRGMFTELFSITDVEMRERYRALVRLVYDAGWRGAGGRHPERLIRDVRNYLRYVQVSLGFVIDGEPLPIHEEPPILDRDSPVVWEPSSSSAIWRDPADGS
ncbi:hypothetical protein [Streptomyces sp. DASNCL29]|uniref:hypothetical protein n=1 Tax=Streptomyces sp. DASNCL29 TaxID=2583819 RepID=UPI00110FB3A4|nr:hypothetical protein [Streptomyces sp. DASNCL29]TMU92388.1 hypothetical protein FGK60_22685 [Streptomyces sp. DASNCL29]